MSELAAFEYAVVRAVPRVDRGEFVNVGVIVYSQAHGFLAARVAVAPAKLLAIDPDADVAEIAAAVDAFVAPSGADSTGPAAATSPGERFRWLTAPRSTIVQTGPVHAGLTDDPAAELTHLVDRLVT